jgi:hypothetical protein
MRAHLNSWHGLRDFGRASINRDRSVRRLARRAHTAGPNDLTDLPSHSRKR